MPASSAAPPPSGSGYLQPRRTAVSAAPATLDSIQALRGLAAAYVLVYHSGLRLGGEPFPLLGWLTEHVIKRGHVGVDVFFVISGFIIAWVAVLGRDDPEPALVFSVRRVFRLAPPYWVMSALHAITLNPVSLAVFGSSLAFLPIAHEDAPYFGYPALYVGWSLNYELAFYAIFALGLLLARRRALTVVAAVLGGTTLLLPWWHFGAVDPNPAHTYPFASTWVAMIANPLVLEFALGCALAWLYARTRHRFTRGVAMALLAIGVGSFAVSLWLVEPEFSLAGRGLPAGALLFGAVAAEQAGLLRVPRSLVWLGELSYALYLTHPTVIEAIKRLMPELAPQQMGLQLTRFAIDAALALGFAMLLHRWVELPAMAVGRRLSGRLATARA